MASDFVISTDVQRLDIDLIAHFLAHDSYWARNRTRAQIERSIQHSLNFGAYHSTGQQVGFARIITDYATFAYLADVFVIQAYRGQGVSKQIMAAIMAHPELQNIRRWMLITADAHGLYAQFGFHQPPKPERYMEKLNEG